MAETRFDADAEISLCRIADALDKLVELERLLLKLRAGDRGVSLAALIAAKEEAEDLPQGIAPNPPVVTREMRENPEWAARQMQEQRSLPVPMHLYEQSPLELFKADLAYQHAEREFGRGKVPPELDLEKYAEEHALGAEEGPTVIEPDGPVPADLLERAAEWAGKD